MKFMELRQMKIWRGGWGWASSVIIKLSHILLALHFAQYRAFSSQLEEIHKLSQYINSAGVE